MNNVIHYRCVVKNKLVGVNLSGKQMHCDVTITVYE